MQSKDRFCLQSILESIDKIEIYAEGISCSENLKEQPIVFDACLMNIINIGEMVNRLSDPFIDANSIIEWQKIRGMRNIIAHDYFGIDYDEIWSILTIHIPILKSYIQHLL